MEDGEAVNYIDALATPAAVAADRLPRAHMRISDEAKATEFQEFLHKGGRLALSDVEV